MSDINPYNCTKPGHLFVGYERLRQSILDGFCNGNSFAIMGGRRCGKTSLLMQLEKDLQMKVLSTFTPLPRYFDMQGVNEPTSARLFEEIYSLAVQDTDADLWQPAKPDRVYQAFLDQLHKAKHALDKKHGKEWLIILLVDELDAVISTLPNDQFFQNLRNLLMISPFHTHFRMVATGVKEMTRLISSGSSPLNNLRNKYVNVLTGRQARRLIQAGFRKELNPDIKQQLYELTGKHPYLLQGVLEKMWEEHSEPDNKSVKEAARDFLREHNGFNCWLKVFGAAEHAVYRCLMAEYGEPVSVADIRARITSELLPDTEEAITVLSYHGIIDDSTSDEPQLAGSMFRNWYQNNSSVDENSPATSSPVEATAQPSQLTNVTNLNVVISPEMTVSPSIINFTANDPAVLDTFEQIIAALANVSVDDHTKMKARHILEEGEHEAKQPGEGAAPDKSVIESSLQRATEILKLAGTTAGSLQTYIEKAEKLSPYIGKVAGWLDTL